jgi:hypothetical protein
MTLQRVSSILSLLAVLVTATTSGCASTDLDADENVIADEARELRVPPARPIAPPVRPQPDAGIRCGTRGGRSCADGEFCNHAPDTQCGATDRGGVCEKRPQICTAIYDPVCGCDHRTYASECQARSAGVAVAREGACGDTDCTAIGGTVRRSNGASVPTCDKGTDGFSLSGLEPTVCCLPKPQAKQMCGGIAGLRCEQGQFCNYEPTAGGQGCGRIADAAGVCEPQPRACTREYRPVCGCDRRTYATACTAHAAGVSVMHADACADVD